LQDGVHIHRCEYHFIVWLIGNRPIIIAIMHERMDLMRRLKDRL
jgi:toxin ParE1/3/4